MAVNIKVKRTDFYNELTKEKQNEYLEIKRNGFMTSIDNIYYTIFLQDDINENVKLQKLINHLDAMKNEVASSHEQVEYGHGLSMDGKSFQTYKYCLTNNDLYDIFIMNYLPNPETPRVLVQIRAFGLWIHGADSMLTESYNGVKEIFEPYGCKPCRCRENRIDYCYHTNIITNPEKVFSDRNINKQMSTTMKRWHQTGRIESNDIGSILRKDYFALGERKSNNVFIRCYNKALEVIEQGYKGFFFELWYQNGLISFYDRYCFEYALIHKNYDYVHKAKLEFYLEYGTDEHVKKEFALTLQDKNMDVSGYKELANAYMPEVTTVMNVEFETKRKFYYYSDEFIDFLNYYPRPEVPGELHRIYRIIDNRTVFLDYLTSATLCFRKSKEKYASWWDKLRHAKLEGYQSDEKLLRDYSAELDERLARVRFINSVATNAVYGGNIDTDFVSDISDVISNLNDNNAAELRFTVNGNLDSKLLKYYNDKKEIKEQRIKNRKKKTNQTVNTERNVSQT